MCFRTSRCLSLLNNHTGFDHESGNVKQVSCSHAYTHSWLTFCTASWQPIDLTTMVFPGIMLVDYIRVYQRSSNPNMGCSPDDYPTEDYIQAHLPAYSSKPISLCAFSYLTIIVDPNLTSWRTATDGTNAGAGYSWPKNSAVRCHLSTSSIHDSPRHSIQVVVNLIWTFFSISHSHYIIALYLCFLTWTGLIFVSFSTTHTEQAIGDILFLQIKAINHPLAHTPGHVL